MPSLGECVIRAAALDVLECAYNYSRRPHFCVGELVWRLGVANWGFRWGEFKDGTKSGIWHKADSKMKRNTRFVLGSYLAHNAVWEAGETIFMP